MERKELLMASAVDAYVSGGIMRSAGRSKHPAPSLFPGCLVEEARHPILPQEASMVRLTDFQRKLIAQSVTTLEARLRFLESTGDLLPWKLVEAMTYGQRMAFWGLAESQIDIDAWITRFEHAA